MRELSEPRRALLELVKRAEVVTVDEAVAATGGSKNAVRAHLLKLEEDGLLERVSVDAGQRGRPPLAYRVAARAKDAFPTDDANILTGLLGFLEARGERDLVDGFFASMWKVREAEYEVALAKQRGAPEEVETRLTALSRVLERHHFMPRVEVDADAVRVSECNCPFPASVRATRAPCRLEAELLGRVVGAPPDRVRYARSVSTPCVFEWDRARRGAR
ncbi:MAG: DeoR family transcriptional regulator [Myxococcales bacterium]|nr:DeoR family transcriptional regulator [Myxococcales bacterium]MCB9649879.1 DeoR family transcriptional regulator [Deltaproteobacteria bacterium]